MTFASPFHQLRGFPVREGATPGTPSGRGAILPNHSTGGAVTAAGGFLDGRFAKDVCHHIIGSNL